MPGRVRLLDVRGRRVVMSAASRGRPGSVVAVGQVLTGTALFGTIGVARVLGPSASAITVGALRAAAAALVLVALAWAWEGRAGLLPAVRRGPVVLAGVAQAAFQVTFLTAVLQTGVAVGTLVAIGSAPVFSGVVHRIRGGVVDPVWLPATLVSVVGLALLLTATPVDGTIPVSGAMLALAAGMSYATYTLATSAAVAAPIEGLGTAPRVGPATTSAATFVVTAAVLAPGLLLGDVTWAASIAGASMLGWLVLAPTVGSYLLLASGLRSLAPPTVSTLGLAEPLVATVLAVVLLSERLGVAGWAGAGVVALGLVVVATTPWLREGSAVREDRPRAR